MIMPELYHDPTVWLVLGQCNTSIVNNQALLMPDDFPHTWIFPYGRDRADVFIPAGGSGLRWMLRECK